MRLITHRQSFLRHSVTNLCHAMCLELRTITAAKAGAQNLYPRFELGRADALLHPTPADRLPMAGGDQT